MTTLYANEVQVHDKIVSDGVAYTITSASVDKGDIVLIGRAHKNGAKAPVVMRMREVDTVEYLGHIGQRDC